MNEKYLIMIQNIISRMADSSFKVKQFSLLTLGAAWGLMGREEQIFQIFWGMSILIVVFWYLSSFYLRCERMYRSIYDEVIKPTGEFKRPKFSLTPTERDRENAGLIIAVMLRSTELYFFAALQIANVCFAFSWEEISSFFSESCCCCPCC